AYIRGLAELNGRNADWAAEAVRTAVSLPASEALKLNVIDVIADDVPDLLRKIDGRSVKVAGKPQALATAGLEIVTAAPDWRTELLAVITDPNVAFILLLIGTYGDRKSTRLNSSHGSISYAVFCLKKKKVTPQ